MRLLLVEDNPDDAGLVERVCRERFDVSVVGSLSAALTALRDAEYPVVITDLNLPDSRRGGLEVVEALSMAMPRTAILGVLTGMDERSLPTWRPGLIAAGARFVMPKSLAMSLQAAPESPLVARIEETWSVRAQDVQRGTERLIGAVDSGLTALDRSLSTHRAEMVGRFDGLSQRMDGHDKRLKEIETCLQDSGGRFARLAALIEDADPKTRAKMAATATGALSLLVTGAGLLLRWMGVAVPFLPPP